MRAAIEFLLEVGVENIAPVVRGLADRIAQGAEAKGYQILLGPRKPESSSGIVCIRKPGFDDKETVRRLRAAGIAAAPRAGWVRLSPHFYISPDDIEQTLEVLP